MTTTLLEGEYVLIIGSSNMDLNIYSERLPKPGETVTGGTFEQSLGGKGANQSVASARSGAKTVFMGKMGQDAFGDQMMAGLTREGIDITRVIRDPEEASGVAFIMIDEHGENMISVAPGANFKLTPEEVKDRSDLIEHAASLIVQMEIPVETISEIFQIAARGNVIKILNPAPLKPLPLETLQNVDILTPNEGELFRLHALLSFNPPAAEGREAIVQASVDITSLGPRYVLTTLGKKGSFLYDSREDESTVIPAYKVEAVDTVGAGDCFNGVLASKLCQGKRLKDAVKYATAAASIAVTRKGAQDSMPHDPEIEKRYQEL